MSTEYFEVGAPVGSSAFIQNVRASEVPINWEPLDGRTVNNVRSPFNGKTLPDMNRDGGAIFTSTTTKTTNGENKLRNRFYTHHLPTDKVYTHSNADLHTANGHPYGGKYARIHHNNTLKITHGSYASSLTSSSAYIVPSYTVFGSSSSGSYYPCNDISGSGYYAMKTLSGSSYSYSNLGHTHRPYVSHDSYGLDSTVQSTTLNTTNYKKSNFQTADYAHIGVDNPVNHKGNHGTWYIRIY